MIVRSGIGAVTPPSGLGVPPVRELVDERLGHVLDRREPAGHVAVQRRVAHRVLGLVPGGQHDRAELVRDRHQQVAAHARLQVLLGHALLRCRRTPRRARTGSASKARLDRDRVDPDPEALRAVLGVLDALGRRVRGRHRHARARRRHRARPRRASPRARSRSRPRARAPPRRSRSCARSRAGPARARGRPPRGRWATPGRSSAKEVSPWMLTIRRSSSNIVARWATVPSGATIIEPPSKTSSSWPPTAFTYAIHEPVWRARRAGSSRARSSSRGGTGSR